MRILFDVSRHLRRRLRSTPTGIDRVDAAYVRLLPQLTEETTYVAKAPGCNPIRGVGRFIEHNGEHPGKEAADGQGTCYAQLTRYLATSTWPSGRGCKRIALQKRSASATADAWLSGVRQIFLSRGLPADLSGSVYLNTSHSGFENAQNIEELRRRGAGIAAMLHDLIPIDFPEYCRDGEYEKHRRRMITLLRLCDLIIANSAYSRDRFLAWLDTDLRAVAMGVRTPKLAVVPLGVETEFLPSAGRRMPVSPVPYFVCLGTIEARKNHALLLQVWSRLAETLGDHCPRLVLVGQRGWKVDHIFDQLAHSVSLGRHVVEVSDLNDSDVASLLLGAHGALQPSLAEGFGLPIMEASALGTPVLASDIPAHREVASLVRRARGIILLDPTNSLQWVQEITMMASRQFKVGTAGAILSWRAHVGQTVEILNEHFFHLTVR